MRHLRTPPPCPRLPRFRAAGRRAALLAIVSASLAIACGRGEDGDVREGLPAALARELTLVPGIGPRLSIGAAYRACSPAQPGAVSAFRGGCTTFAAAAARTEGVAEVAVKAARARLDPGAMHAAALIDLLYEPGLGKSLHRSISSLHAAARQAERPAPVLADLAAAYLVRAERARAPRDLLAALEAAEEALEHEPRNGAALYNRALALERFGLVEEAARDWRAYLEADPASPWADEARRRLAGLEDLPSIPPAPAADASPAEYQAYAATDPQGARTLGWCSVLGDWAEATLAGDAEGAEGRLARADALGAALARQSGGDQSLADGVRDIRRSGGGRRPAEAHREFAAGCALEQRVEFAAAEPRFASAEAAADRLPTLRSLARLAHGSVLFRTGRGVAGEAIFRALAAVVDTTRYPAVAGHARQLLASRLLRTQRLEGGLEEAHRAVTLFGRTEERENEGAAWYAMSIAHFRMREMDDGYAAARRGLEVLRAHRASHRLHNLLSSTAETAAEDGFTRAAVRLQDEGVRVAGRTGEAFYVAEARLTRARLLAATGAFARAEEDVAAARAVLSGIREAGARGWISAQLQLAGAAITLRGNPARAAPGVDSAVAYLRGIDAPLVVLPAIVEGARAWLAAGDLARGETRLDAALVLLEERRDSIRMEPRRASVFAAAQSVVDRASLLRLAVGRTTDALATLDRGRASLATVGGNGPGGAGGEVEGPPGAIAVEYALIGDTLLAWTVAGRDVRLSRTLVDSAALVRSIDALLTQMEHNAGSRQIRPLLERLYDWIVRPIESRLGPAGTPLVVIADGDLASVPFAALRDARRQQYLLEDHPLRFAASLHEARRARRPLLSGAALLVADPAFDAAAHPAFGRLAGATGEVAEIAAGYPRPRVLADRAADGASFRAALAGASVVHYAGHAVFDDERPERSYLLLAGAPDRTATLPASEIAQMDLRHIALVVLSACETVRTGRGRAAGFSGLAGAFLAAGAGGAVGTLWEVDDGSTRRLMATFHAAYRVSHDASQALRAAQVTLLRSGDARLSSPSAWAAFRYTGS